MRHGWRRIRSGIRETVIAKAANKVSERSTMIIGRRRLTVIHNRVDVRWKTMYDSLDPHKIHSFILNLYVGIDEKYLRWNKVEVIH